MPGTRVTRLRSGSMPDTSSALLDARRATSGRTPAAAASPAPPAAPGRPSATPRLVATGARLIRESGGSKADLDAWRRLSLARRHAIKARVTARGGSLTRAVRKLG